MRFSGVGLIGLLLGAAAGAQVQPPYPKGTGQGQPLRVLIYPEQTTLTAPFPARLTLHLHNAGLETLWLYRRARANADEGSTMEIHLEPEEAPKRASIAARASAAVFDSAGLPRPRLVKLPPGDDHEEKTTVRLTPAEIQSGGKTELLWGRYRLSGTYRAAYSNGEAISRNLNAKVWQGQAESNAVEIELQPPSAAAQGSVSGTVVHEDGRPIPDMLVSLSDQQERMLGQLRTDSSGRFSFTRFPPALYWVTARLLGVSNDISTFRHVELTPDEPSARIELVLLIPDVYEPKQILHKPVLIRLTDREGRPAKQVKVEATWSNGPVMESVKGESDDDGTLALELIPGRNFVTLRQPGCQKEEYRADVAEGDGIDGFKLEVACPKK